MSCAFVVDGMISTLAQFLLLKSRMVWQRVCRAVLPGFRWQIVAGRGD